MAPCSPILTYIIISISETVKQAGTRKPGSAAGPLAQANGQRSWQKRAQKQHRPEIQGICQPRWLTAVLAGAKPSFLAFYPGRPSFTGNSLDPLQNRLMSKTDEPKYRAPALEKGLDILELLAGSREPMSLNQISARLGRSASELFRMVQVLELRGYVGAADSGGGYILTNKLFAIGIQGARTKDLVEAALPVMRKLTERVYQSCHIAVVSGDQMVVVARVEAPGDLGFSVRVGYRMSLVSCASGLVLYAFQPESVRAEWKERLSQSLSRRAWADFEERGHCVRKAGHLIVDSTAVAGVVDLSAPVMQLGSVAAALTMPYVHTVHSMPIPKTVAEVVTAADAIAKDLGAGKAS
jgi:DNA-binding IclR family transcriptional regulator